MQQARTGCQPGPKIGRAAEKALTFPLCCDIIIVRENTNKVRNMHCHASALRKADAWNCLRLPETGRALCENAMKNKELKRLSRTELLELLLLERKRNNALEQELRKAREQLEDRTLRVECAGTLAEAAMNINMLFEAADAAAAQYLENIRHRSEAAEQEAAQLLEQTRRQCEAMLQQARREAVLAGAEAGMQAKPLPKDGTP